MFVALARIGQRACHLPAAMALLLGLAGNLARDPESAPDPEPRRVSADVLAIDDVLAQRSPDLGLDLRRSVATAIVEESRRGGLDPLLVLGLIEVESSFDGEAVSWAGARGLVQLRPGTIEYLAEMEGLRLSADELWRDPVLQVRLGVRYLCRLQKQFGALDLGLMAYNAGPVRLRGALRDGDVERYRGYARAVRRSHARFKLIAPDWALAQAEPRFPKLLDGADLVAMP